MSHQSSLYLLLACDDCQTARYWLKLMTAYVIGQVVFENERRGNFVKQSNDPLAKPASSMAWLAANINNVKPNAKSVA